MLSMGNKESWGIILYGFYVKKKKKINKQKENLRT